MSNLADFHRFSKHIFRNIFSRHIRHCFQLFKNLDSARLFDIQFLETEYKIRARDAYVLRDKITQHVCLLTAHLLLFLGKIF